MGGTGSGSEADLLPSGVFSARTSETEWEGTRESVVHEVHNLQGRTN